LRVAGGGQRRGAHRHARPPRLPGAPLDARRHDLLGRLRSQRRRTGPIRPRASTVTSNPDLATRHPQGLGLQKQAGDRAGVVPLGADARMHARMQVTRRSWRPDQKYDVAYFDGRRILPCRATRILRLRARAAGFRHELVVRKWRVLPPSTLPITPRLRSARSRRDSDGAGGRVFAAISSQDLGPSLNTSAIPSFAATEIACETQAPIASTAAAPSLQMALPTT